MFLADQDEEIFDPTLYLFNNRVPPSKTSMDSHYYVGYDAEELNYEDTGEEMMVTSPLVRDCKEFHVLLRGFKASNRICFHISQDNNNNTDITLLHDSITGITLSGRLADDRSFRRYDLLNSKLRLRAEIRDDKVVITQGLDVKTYNWNSSFDLDGFLQKDRENIKVIINDGVYCTIFRTAQTFRLSLSVEEQHSPTNHTIGGIIGQLLNNNKTSFYLNNSAGDPILPSQRFNDCDFSPYEAENPGSCLFTSVQEKDLTNATN
ncbi:uncharacterized protein [Pyxicephalus adspersus]|uniref:uncharacterized protein n=1 Tax=Pyxicephalus adspersus TaxID=30357 RepID=UPI003B5B110D